MEQQNATSKQPTTWANLLRDAVTTPGRIHTAYSAFHGYSIGNQLLALWQCAERGIEPGPIATYKNWAGKGRQVRKGEKAITLCQPVTVKAKARSQRDADTIRRIFIYRPSRMVFISWSTTRQATTRLPNSGAPGDSWRMVEL